MTITTNISKGTKFAVAAGAFVAAVLLAVCLIPGKALADTTNPLTLKFPSDGGVSSGVDTSVNKVQLYVNDVEKTASEIQRGDTVKVVVTLHARYCVMYCSVGSLHHGQITVDEKELNKYTSNTMHTYTYEFTMRSDDDAILNVGLDYKSTTLTLNDNGGTGGEGTVRVAQWMDKVDVTTLPTREGYTFDGYWDAKKGGTQYVYANGNGNFWNKPMEKTTLYAHWKAVPAEEKTTDPTITNTGDTTPFVLGGVAIAAAAVGVVAASRKLGRKEF